MKHWWIMSPWHIVLLEQLMYLAHAGPHLCLFFLCPHPPTQAQVRKHFCHKEEMQVYFHTEQSGIPLFRVLWGSSCHPSRHHTLAKVTAWTGQWSPWTGSHQWGKCFCSSLISHQAWNCHLPWSSVTMAQSREIRTSSWKNAASYSSSDLEAVGG